MIHDFGANHCVNEFSQKKNVGLLKSRLCRRALTRSQTLIAAKRQNTDVANKQTSNWQNGCGPGAYLKAFE